jgi:hypothetical protein
MKPALARRAQAGADMKSLRFSASACWLRPKLAPVAVKAAVNCFKLAILTPRCNKRTIHSPSPAARH